MSCVILVFLTSGDASANQIDQSQIDKQYEIFSTNVTASPFIIADEMEGVKLEPYVELFEDKDGQLDIDEISSPAYTSQFLAPGLRSPNIGFSSSVWWARLTLVNESAADKTVILRQMYPLIDYINLWEGKADGGWKLHRAGDQISFYERDIEHRDFLFPIDVPAHSQLTHYLRFETSGPVDIAMHLYSPLRLIKALSVEQLFYGAYYGGFLVLVLYYLFIFMAVRDKAFLYYLLYVVSYGLYMGGHNGITFQLLWPDSPQWGNQTLLVFLALSLLWALQFSRKILVIEAFSVKLDKVSMAIMWVLWASFAGSWILPYSIMIIVLSALTLVVMPIILVMGVGRLLSGAISARYFMLAWSALIIGVIVYMLKIFGWLPHTFFTENGFQIGSLIEIVLLSLALGSRVNDLKQQSRTDALTSLANRREFDELLQDEFHRADRYGQPLSLLMIDIDFFKNFNDRFGHIKGDEVLKKVGNLLQSSVRKPYVPCRFGGEEFAVILPRADCAAAEVLAERLRSRVEYESAGEQQVTISVGLSCSLEDTIVNAGQLLDAADQALYYAKEQGRNRIVNAAFFSGG